MSLVEIALALVAAYGIFTAERVETDGPDEQGYRWERRLDAFPVSAIAVIRDGNIAMNCGVEYGATSCFRRDEVARTCDVYLPLGYAAWQEAHERRHCAGWIHPGGLSW